jgi:hypothetical protein
MPNFGAPGIEARIAGKENNTAACRAITFRLGGRFLRMTISVIATLFIAQIEVSKKPNKPIAIVSELRETTICSRDSPELQSDAKSHAPTTPSQLPSESDAKGTRLTEISMPGSPVPAK